MSEEEYPACPECGYKHVPLDDEEREWTLTEAEAILVVLWREYGLADERTLTKGAKALKAVLMTLVEGTYP